MGNRKTLLSEICTPRTKKIISGKDPEKPYIGLEHIASYNHYLVGTSSGDTSISANSVFEEGDILFGKLRPNLRKSIQADFDGYCSTDILTLEPNSNVVSSFVGKVFQWDVLFDFAISTAEGTKMPRTSWHKLKDFLVFLPPLPEQCRIAEILDTLDEAILETERLIAKLRDIKTGLLHDLLTRGLDAAGNLRDPETHPEQFKDSLLGRIPKEWEVKPLADCTLSSAFGPRFPGSAYTQHGNVATMRTTDMDDEGNLSLDAMPLAELDINAYRPHLLNIGDFLISRSGTCGIAAVFERFHLPVLPGAFLIRFRFNDTLLPQFLRRYINWEVGRSRVLLYAEGGVQKNLRGSTLLQLLIPLPSRSEQTNILQVLNHHDKRIQEEEAYRDKLKVMKKGLMEDLLTGKVRVTNE